LARVRGAAIPVFDLRLFLGASSGTEAQRWVSVSIEGRGVALAVDEVLDVRELGSLPLAQMPPLLAAGAPAIEALASLDSQLLVLLQAARLLPVLDGLAAGPA
jgi:chemotaxis signal transduction protein